MAAPAASSAAVAAASADPADGEQLASRNHAPLSAAPVPAWWHGPAAGALAGVTARLVVYPADTIKAQLQVQGSLQCNPATSSATAAASSASASASSRTSAGAPGAPPAAHASAAARPQQPPQLHQQAPLRGTLAAARAILAAEGAPGFYRGLGAVLVGVVPANLAYFGGYEASKAAIAGAWGGPGGQPLLPPGPAADMAAGVGAQVLAGVVYTPIDIVKERLQVGRGHKPPGVVVRESAYKRSRMLKGWGKGGSQDQQLSGMWTEGEGPWRQGVGACRCIWRVSCAALFTFLVMSLRTPLLFPCHHCCLCVYVRSCVCMCVCVYFCMCVSLQATLSLSSFHLFAHMQPQGLVPSTAKPQPLPSCPSP